MPCVEGKRCLRGNGILQISGLGCGLGYGLNFVLGCGLGANISLSKLIDGLNFNGEQTTEECGLWFGL